MTRAFLTCLCLAAAPAPATALELTMTGSYSLNRPSSLDYDPAFCGLWIANEGPEVILVTLEGDELRRLRSDLSRIKAITVEGNDLLVADGMGGFQRITKNGEALGAPFKVSDGWADTEGIVIGAKRFSRRMHLNEEQKRALKREMHEYELMMDGRAADLFR